MNAVDSVPVIGQPLAYGLGFIMLIFIVFTDSWARSLVTVAHEGGHMAMAMVTWRGHQGFELTDGGGGETTLSKTGWGIGEILILLSGYPAPPLLGLGGAAVIRHGHAWSVLWAALVLLLVALFQAKNSLALLVTALAFLSVGWAALNGSPYLQAAVAIGLVWWMLFGGAYWSSVYLTQGTSDASALAGATLIPRIMWDMLFASIGIICLWAGGHYLLRR
ncbi:M50 family metallopeptidase [Pseudonocardia sp. Cha107L01]|uniref:M50 family metallopeptidase n=1 Tax=Pseudonocardia sp. Cha107L01 TaxID=3457576 RepID=UPI00403EBAB9